jgi:hypothetical protein
MLSTAPIDNLLGAFATTSKIQTTASTDNFLGVFAETNNPEVSVQVLDAEPANYLLVYRHFPSSQSPEDKKQKVFVYSP